MLRPVFRGDIVTGSGLPLTIEFLADTGADRTVFCASVLRVLGLPSVSAATQLGGVGGATPTVFIDTAIQLPRADGGNAVFRGHFAAFTAPDALDMSVLGRDVTNLFTLIVDRQRDVVCLLGAGHQYTITMVPPTVSS